MVADLFDANDQQYAIAFIVLSSVGGTTVGPFIGGFVEAHLSLPWVIWIQLIFGGFTQPLHFFLVPETNTSTLLDRIAKKERKEGQRNIYGPGD